VSDNDTATEEHSINLSMVFSIHKRGIKDLNNISVWHMSYDQTILHCRGDAWTNCSFSDVWVCEERVKEVWRSLFETWLWWSLFCDFSGLSFASLLSCSCQTSLLCLFLSELFSSWCSRLNFYEFLCISLCLNGLHQQLTLVIREIEPELVISNWFVANQTKLLRLTN